MIKMRIAYLLIFLISLAVYSYIPNIYSQQFIGIKMITGHIM